MTDIEGWLDYADAKHEDSKADRCQCGGEARYWLPGDRYACWDCYKKALLRVNVSVGWLSPQYGITERDKPDTSEKA